MVTTVLVTVFFAMIFSITWELSKVSFFDDLLQLKIKSKKFKATKEERVRVIIIIIAVRLKSSIGI